MTLQDLAKVNGTSIWEILTEAFPDELLRGWRSRGFEQFCADRLVKALNHLLGDNPERRVTAQVVTMSGEGHPLRADILVAYRLGQDRDWIPNCRLVLEPTLEDLEEDK